MCSKRKMHLERNFKYNQITKAMKKYFSFILGTLMLVSCGTAALPTQTQSTTYAIGDIYNQNGVTGIVVEVDNTGKHGKLMSLKSTNAKWCSNKDYKFETSAFYEDDGEKNMAAIDKFIKENNASWEEFPLFQWARSLGEGWYIPAKDETLQLWRNINGGSNVYNPKVFKAFNKNQKSYGGDSFFQPQFGIGMKQPWAWVTSTEADGGNAYAVQFGLDIKSQLMVAFHAEFQPWVCYKNLNPGIARSRAIHKF